MNTHVYSTLERHGNGRWQYNLQGSYSMALKNLMSQKSRYHLSTLSVSKKRRFVNRNVEWSILLQVLQGIIKQLQELVLGVSEILKLPYFVTFKVQNF